MFVTNPQRKRAIDCGLLLSILMNVIWRTLLILWRAKRKLRRNGAADPMMVSRVRLTTLPTDLDLLGHMNNGRYLSLFDLGRFDLLVRTGVWDALKQQGWYAVVASETITFRKSLQLWQRFDVESRLIGHDEKGAYLEHRAVVDGEIYTRVIVRARLLKRSGGIVKPEELFEALHRPDNLPELEPWMERWAVDAALPSTKAPAPSTWE